MRDIRKVGTALTRLLAGCALIGLPALGAFAQGAGPVSPRAVQAARPAATSRPNVLIIVADDMGYGEVGFQGYAKDIPTPNLDSIAANGARFSAGYVSGPYCSPTRAALITGRYQERTGHEFNPDQRSEVRYGGAPGLVPSEQTIGDRFKAAGYVTGWFGKAHLGQAEDQNPIRRGFDEFYGFLPAAHTYLGLEGGPNGRNPILRGAQPVTEEPMGGKPYYTTDAFGRETVSFIERNKDRPWLVYLAFNAVHAPLQATEVYEGRFANIAAPKRRKFAAMLSALDDNVGQVLRTLREQGLEENTLIFFVSDNGGPTAQTTSSNGPLRGFKATTWEGGVRVPFAVQWKGHIPAGKVLDQPIIQLDVLPTALAATGTQVLPDWKLDGVNLLPYLEGEAKAPPQRDLFWRFGGQLAIRHGKWKLVKGRDSPGNAAEALGFKGKAEVDGAHLYDLVSDPGEKTDLAGSEPAVVRDLAARWQAWNAELPEARWIPQGPPRAGKGQGKAKGKANPQAR